MTMSITLIRKLNFKRLTLVVNPCFHFWSKVWTIYIIKYTLKDDLCLVWWLSSKYYYHKVSTEQIYPLIAFEFVIFNKKICWSVESTWKQKCIINLIKVESKNV